MEEIKNESEEEIKNSSLSLEDIVNDLLMCEKNISNNYSIVCNEMSNKYLYKIILGILNDTKNIARELYNISFEKGWYSLTIEKEDEINKIYNEYYKKMKELS